MQCYNCGYINFQRVKKCPSCSTSLKGTQSHVELAEDPMFTVFAGELPDFGSDYQSKTALDDEFGVEDTPSNNGDFGLDLGEVEGADDEFRVTEEAVSMDVGFDEAHESPISTGMASDVGPNDFELDLSEAIAEQIMASSSPMPADSVEFADEVVDNDMDTELDIEANADVDLDLEPTIEADADLDLDLEPTVEADVDLDLDLEPTVETDTGTDLNIEGIEFGLDDAGEPETAEVATDDLDLDLDTENEEPTLVLDAEPEIELPDEEPAPEPALELTEEMDVDTSGDDEIEFNLVDDEVEPPEAVEPGEKKADEGGIDFGGLEMEETPDAEK